VDNSAVNNLLFDCRIIRIPFDVFVQIVNIVAIREFDHSTYGAWAIKTIYSVGIIPILVRPAVCHFFGVLA
jgi:hypothetical protein